MSARIAMIVAGVLATWPAIAGEMGPDEARRFVTGKLFVYSCFDGTSGAGRIFADGSVAGTIRMRGQGPVRYAMLPPGTMKVKSDAVCASLKGLPFEPCFNLVKTDSNTFRGSVRGMNFAYCTFTKRNPRTNVVGAAAAPVALRASAANTARSN